MPTVSTTYAASTHPTCAARSRPRPTSGRRGSRRGRRRRRRWARGAVTFLAAETDDGLLPGAQDADAVGAERGHLVPTRASTSSADQPVLDSIMCDSYSLEKRIAAPSMRLADQVALAEGQLLARVGDERVAALAALLGVPQHAVGVVGADQDVLRLRPPAPRSGRARSAGPRSSRRGRTTRTAPSWGRWCTRTGPCAGCRRCAPSRSRRCAAPATSGSPRSPHRPRRRAPDAARAGPARSTCWGPRRRAGSRGPRRGRTPRACPAARRRASRRTCRRTSSGGRWRWIRR